MSKPRSSSRSHNRPHHRRRKFSVARMIFIAFMGCIAFVVVAIAYYIFSGNSALMDWELHLVQAVAGVISAWRK